MAPLVRPRYGVDAPAVPAVNGAAGVACWLAAAQTPYLYLGGRITPRVG
jgi:hypothetical protein